MRKHPDPAGQQAFQAVTLEMYVAAGRGSGAEGVTGSPSGSLLPRLTDISQLWERGLGRAGSKQSLSRDESFTGAQCYN